MPAQDSLFDCSQQGDAASSRQRRQCASKDPVKKSKARVRLSDVLENRNNNFNAVRLLAAVCVVVSHSFLLVKGDPAAEPMSSTPYTLGQHAVNVFFFLSGLMLSRSFAIQPNWRTFATARVLRIFPGLFVCSAVVAWILGPFGTELSIGEYFHDGHTLVYPFASLLVFDRAPLHEIFIGSTHPNIVNDPLWTIKYELFAYLVFGLCMSVGLITKRSVALLGCLLLGTALTLLNSLPGSLSAPPMGSFLRFGFCFALGVIAYRYRLNIAVHGAPAAVLLLFAYSAIGTVVAQVAFIVGLAYVAIVIGSIEIPRITKLTSASDISFGLYLYAWPIQQLVLVTGGASIPVTAHLAISLVFASLFAALSWIIIEKPALSLKARFKRSDKQHPVAPTSARSLPSSA